MRVAARFLSPDMRVLDIGCSDGALFKRYPGFSKQSLGIEPDLNAPVEVNGIACIPGTFPDALPPGRQFDAALMLAVLEHFPEGDCERLAGALYSALAPNGVLIITVPAPIVDQILDVLKALHVLHGMALEEHHGFRPSDTLRIFTTPRYELSCHRRFQLGLNHVFTFRRMTPSP
jgi:SAM-dependent methyltransferase